MSFERDFYANGGGRSSLLGSVRRTFTNESSGSRGSGSGRKDVRDKQPVHQQQQYDGISSLRHLASFVDAPSRPFLAQQSLPSAIVEPHEIIEGKLLGEGDFSKTFEIKSFKFSKSKTNRLANEDNSKTNNKKKNRRSYAVKRLHIKSVADGQGGDSNSSGGHISVSFDLAAKKLILECLYLSSLSHPFILTFRGFYLKSEAAFANRQLDAFHLVTDRLGETLEQRMNKWKDDRQKLQKEDPTERFIEAAVRVDLSVSFSSSLNMHRSFHDEGSETSSSKVTRYPQDLVALQTNYALQIAHALEYLHERGIVYRDLKPSTVGFKDYPNQHTIQLFHFGSCHEVPSNGALLPPESVDVMSSFDERRNSGSRSRRSALSRGLSVSHHIRKSSISESLAPVMPRTVCKFYRAPESYPFVTHPGNTAARKLLSAPLNQSVIHVTVTNLTNPNMASNRVTIPITETRSQQQPTAIAPEKKDPTYRYFGYNCKADVYSWAMIFYEMLAYIRPCDDSTLQQDDYFHFVQSQGLRPTLGKHHFPRTIKVLLAQGWHPQVEKRLSATQLRQRLTVMLQMLENKGTPVVLGLVPTDIGSAASGSSTGTISSEDHPQQDTLDQLNYLPIRAQALLIGANRHGGPPSGGWSSVWNPKANGSNKLDSVEVMDAIQERRFPKNKIPGGPKKKQQKKTEKSLSIRDFLPDLTVGMIEDEINVAQANRLLRGNYKRKKKL